jgi:hypothetical protein
MVTVFHTALGLSRIKCNRNEKRYNVTAAKDLAGVDRPYRFGFIMHHAGIDHIEGCR